MVDISCVKKITSNEEQKWEKIRCSLFVRNDLIKLTYKEISSLDNELHYELHYVKMKRDYLYLKIYHDSIKETLDNEKLLKYFESVLLANGFDVIKI